MSNDLIKLAEERIDSNDKLVSFIDRVKTSTIPLFPETVSFIDKAMKYGAAIVTVNTNLDQYGNNRDIYKNESGGYCLHLTKINEIGQQAGIQVTDSRIIERRTDEHGRVVFISHQIKGRMRSVDGATKEDVATGKYDYYRDLEKYVDYKTGEPKTKMINARRSHAEALAESNAKTRLFNKLVAKLPTSFTLDELKKPFLIPYVIEDKDEILKDLPKEDQLQIKKELVRQRLGLLGNMYPNSNNNAPQLAQPNDSPSQMNDTESFENNIPEATVIEENGSFMSQEEQNKIIAKEFATASQNERTKKILELVKETNFRDPKNAPITESRIEKQSVQGQILFIEKLLNLLVAEELPL